MPHGPQEGAAASMGLDSIALSLTDCMQMG